MPKRRGREILPMLVDLYSGNAATPCMSTGIDRPRGAPFFQHLLGGFPQAVSPEHVRGTAEKGLEQQTALRPFEGAADGACFRGVPPTMLGRVRSTHGDKRKLSILSESSPTLLSLDPFALSFDIECRVQITRLQGPLTLEPLFSR